MQLVRTGSWFTNIRLLRGSGRGRCELSVRFNRIGFRLCSKRPTFPRVVRGGSWIIGRPIRIRCAYRLYHWPGFRIASYGFRCIKP